MGASNISGISEVALLPLAVLAQLADVELARRYFRTGEALYHRAEYAAALEEFQKSYELSGGPELYYNIALCYEKLSRFKEAIAAYRIYLKRLPNAPDHQEISSRIDSLTRQIGEPPTPPDGKNGRYIPPSDRIKPVGAPYKMLMWSSFALSAVGLTAGVIGASKAEEKEGEYDDIVDNLRAEGKIVGNPGRFVDDEAGERYEGELNSLKNDINKFDRIEVAGFASGAVLLGLGGLFLWLDRKQTAVVTVEPSPSGASVSLGVSF